LTSTYAPSRRPADDAPPQAGRRRPARGRSNNRVGFVLLAPALVVVLLGFVLPAVYALRLSFYDSNLGAQDEFVGFSNYSAMFRSSEFWQSTRVTTIYAVCAVAGSVIAGLVVAVALNRRFPGRGVARSIMLIPWATPLVVAALIWRWCMDPQYGVLNHVLSFVGFGQIQWLSSPHAALVAIILVEIWRTAPMAMVMYLAGLQTIPGTLYEAGRIDGASAWQLFRHITLPGLRTTTTVIILLTSVWSFGRSFTVAYLMTGGGPSGSTELLTLLTYNSGFQYLQFGSASALGMVVLAISSVFTAIFLLVRRTK